MSTKADYSTQPPPTKDVYYVSGSTSILAKDFGRAILRQFPGHIFTEEAIPFVRNIEDARNALKKIKKQSRNDKPVVISSLLTGELNSIFVCDEIFLFKIFDLFLDQFEDILGAKALRHAGKGRLQNDQAAASRVSAIHFSIVHDDGTGVQDYDEADLIIIGVSRSGKTPVSVFLATQLGLKTANHPLIDKDLSSCCLKPAIQKNLHKVVALSMDPVLLKKFRENRLPGSTYASLSSCRSESRMANNIYKKYSIPVVHSGRSSIEETAMQVVRVSGLSNR